MQSIGIEINLSIIFRQFSMFDKEWFRIPVRAGNELIGQDQSSNPSSLVSGKLEKKCA